MGDGESVKIPSPFQTEYAVQTINAKLEECQRKVVSSGSSTLGLVPASTLINMNSLRISRVSKGTCRMGSRVNCESITFRLCRLSIRLMMLEGVRANWRRGSLSKTTGKNPFQFERAVGQRSIRRVSPGPESRPAPARKDE
jgi:hypothetical protein